jgi:branched-chain amino acid transport system permease protein
VNRFLAAGRVPFGLSALIAVVTVVIATLGSGSIVSTLTVALINIVLVVGLYTFVGNSGIHSFGQLAFAAVGAYTAGITAMPLNLKSIILPNLPGPLGGFALAPFAAVLAGGLVAAVFGLIVVLPLSRINGLAAGLATVALLIAVNVVAANWDAVTNGTKALSSIPISTTVWVALGWAVAAVVVSWLFQRSPSGKRLRASKSDEVAAVAAGIRVGRERGIAFVISAFLTGVGGALFALQLGSVTPDVFYLTYTFLVIAMLVIGGTDSLTGAVVGGIVVSVLSEVLSRAENGNVLGLFDVPARPGLANVGLGVLMVLILLFRPSGITGGTEFTTWRWRRRRPPAAPETPPEPPAAPTADRELVKEHS